ncbi:MAG TPA: prepilin-type N-terminal cleavage/methylation domain-containing protein [Thermoanaerobaculaceae bacterium]|nr:prepilin-type N-terminal cleavage/methylation domain-containing protein [Thermoanaerobaculaceae bacterium]
MKEEAAQRGFTLLEALVVVAIIGIAAALAVVQVNKAWQRSRLESAAGDIQSFLQSAYTYMVNSRAPVFVVMTLSGSSPTTMAVWQNADGSGVQYGSTYTFPDFLSVTPSNWPNGTAASTKELECDGAGRTLDPSVSPPVMVVQPPTLAITHVDMVAGSLRPNTVYTLTLAGLWKPQLVKAVS